MQCINNLIIFRIAFSNRFRCVIHTKNCLRGSNKNPVNYFKGHKVATCWHPIPTILQTEKYLQRGTDRLIWRSDIICSSVYHTPGTNGLLVDNWFLFPGVLVLLTSPICQKHCLCGWFWRHPRITGNLFDKLTGFSLLLLEGWTEGRHGNCTQCLLPLQSAKDRSLNSA